MLDIDHHETVETEQDSCILETDMESIESRNQPKSIESPVSIFLNLSQKIPP
jgi:hypothetical protein